MISPRPYLLLTAYYVLTTYYSPSDDLAEADAQLDRTATDGHLLAADADQRHLAPHLAHLGADRW